jgi:hypothetical protein
MTNYIGIARDGNIAVPENCLDHDICYAKLMQIGSQSPPESMPAAPADWLARQCRKNNRSNDAFKVYWPTVYPLEEIFPGARILYVRFQDLF